MRYYSLFTIFTALLFFSSCKKELDIDYNTVTPLYAIEAYVTNEGSTATVTLTQDVMSTDSAIAVDDAIITVTGSDGSAFTLLPKGGGEYSAPDKGHAGVTYTMTAKMGDVITTASSTMQDSVIVDSCWFFKQMIVDRPTYTYEMVVRDSGDILRNYYIRLYRNGKAYKWNPHQNKQSMKGTLTLDIICFNENDNAEESQKLRNWLVDGDVVTGNITRVDSISYNFYSSWKTAGRTYNNPVTNLSNGVLGIFSAQYITRFPQITFQKSTIPMK